MIKIINNEKMDSLDALMNCSSCGSNKDVKKIEVGRREGIKQSIFLCSNCMKLITNSNQ